MAPTVQGVYTGAITTAANPTVDFAGTPEAGDVLILGVTAGSNVDPVSAVSGCGATWARISAVGGNYLYSFWMGTGATGGGTITTTGAASANGKVARVFHLRGVDPVVVGQAYSATYPMRANGNQIVLAWGHSTSSTVGASLTQTTKQPGGAWTDQAEMVYPGSNGRSNTSYLLPTAPVGAALEGSSAGVNLVVGSPVPGGTVTEVTKLYNAGAETSSTGWQSTNVSTFASSTDFAMFGTRSLKMTANAAVPTVQRNISGSHPGPYILPGRTYTVSAYVRSVNARNGRANIRWANQSGTVSSTTNGATVALPAGVWTRLTVTGVAPAGQYVAAPQVEITDGISGDVTYTDGWKIEEGASATAFIDGSVTTADRLNINVPSSDYYTVQTTVPPTPTPTVQGVFYGAVTTAANPTVEVSATPAAGDVLILSDVRGSTVIASAPESTAVAGCGATWTKIGGGTDYQSFWIGTGATFSGTVTATAAASATGRHIRVHHLRGVSPDVYIQQHLSTYPVVATNNQIVLGTAYSQSAATPIAGTTPSTGWTTDTATTVTTERIFNTAHTVPRYGESFNVTPLIYGVMLVIGSPVAGMAVARRNLVGNPSGETTNGDWLGSGTTTRARTLATSAVGAGSITANYNASATAIIRKATGSNGPQGPALPGRTYTISCYVRCNNARDAGVVIMWMNLTQGIMTTGTYDTLTPLVANTWTRVSWTGVAPAGTYWVAPECKITGCLAGDVYWWDGFLIEEGTSEVRDYFDGSTTPPPGDLNYFVGPSDLYQSLQLTPVPLTTGTVNFNRREGGAWISRTADPKVRVGAEWITRVPKYWDGSAWVDLP